LTESYQSFGEIGTAALMMVAKSNGITLDIDAARSAIIPPLHSLPPHADVIPALEILAKKGYQMVSLTNSSFAGVTQQLGSAGLTSYFTKLYSVEAVKRFKPHSAPYQFVLQDLQLEPEETLMVAAHAWDLMGAKNVGLQTAFIERPGKQLYPNTIQPDYVADNLLSLVDQLG
ncbi:MAG: haloacid dehalogenase type II, partial [Bacteroidota bacterium]